MKLKILGTAKLIISTLATKWRLVICNTSGGIYRIHASAAKIGKTIASADRGLVTAW